MIGIGLPEADKNEIRSTTIYGYNIERKAFYALAMYEKEFCECEIPFQLLQNKYVNIKDYYTKNPAAKTLRRMTYHPLGTMRLKEYTEENSIFNALVYKIQREYSGGVSNRSNFDENGRPILNTLWFTGMDCLLGIKNKLQELMSDIDENIRFYVPHAARSSYILYEHRKRIICDMKWISDKIGLDKDERTKWVIREYKKLSNNMEILHNLLNKAWLTFDRTIMRNVIDKIEFQYKNEKMLLTEFVNIAFARYTYIQSRDFFIDNNLLFDCTSQ